MTPPYASGPPGTAPHPSAQQYGSPPSAPAPARPRRGVWVLGLVAAVGFAAAAALAVIGSFQALYLLKLRLGQETSSEGTLTQTLWDNSTSGGVTGSGPLPDLAGIPVVAGSALLVVAALVAVVAAFRPGRGLATTVRVVGGVGAGALAGAVGMVALTVGGLVTRTLDQDLPQGGQADINTDTGLVLLLAGAGVGLLALVPALIRREAGAGRVEPATPSMGFRAPGGYAQHPGAYGQQGPGTGQVPAHQFGTGQHAAQPGGPGTGQVPAQQGAHPSAAGQHAGAQHGAQHPGGKVGVPQSGPQHALAGGQTGPLLGGAPQHAAPTVAQHAATPVDASSATTATVAAPWATPAGDDGSAVTQVVAKAQASGAEPTAVTETRTEAVTPTGPTTTEVPPAADDTSSTTTAPAPDTTPSATADAEPEGAPASPAVPESPAATPTADSEPGETATAADSTAPDDTAVTAESPVTEDIPAAAPAPSPAADSADTTAAPDDEPTAIPTPDTGSEGSPDHPVEASGDGTSEKATTEDYTGSAGAAVPAAESAPTAVLPQSEPAKDEAKTKSD